MTGLNGHRVYLDWNATAPLRPEARAAMLQAMDVVGNPSSVHAEGRAAKKIIEKARAQVAALVGCEPSEVVFTSGATEANVAVCRGPREIYMSQTEHESMVDAAQFSGAEDVAIEVDQNGKLKASAVEFAETESSGRGTLWSIAAASGETGVCHYLSALHRAPGSARRHSDITQAAGKYAISFKELELHLASLSGHKIGGPKGVGALCVRSGVDLAPLIHGGGQEQGRRSGTENVIGIAGFGAAAEAAQRDLEAGVWEPVEKLRNILEDRLADAAKETIFFGQESPRLPNTSCFAVPGWKGETQVMQMDLAGFAVSAGSACSSGKVDKASWVLLAMGFDEITASSAIRVSMGPTTTEAEVMAFADTWIDAYRRRKARAA